MSFQVNFTGHVTDAVVGEGEEGLHRSAEEIEQEVFRKVADLVAELNGDPRITGINGRFIGQHVKDTALPNPNQQSSKPGGTYDQAITRGDVEG